MYLAPSPQNTPVRVAWKATNFRILVSKHSGNEVEITFYNFSRVFSQAGHFQENSRTEKSETLNSSQGNVGKFVEDA